MKKIRYLRILRRIIYISIIPNAIFTLTQIQDENFVSAILISHMLLWFIVSAISMKIKCPNCGKSFSMQDHSRNPWTRTCLNCGISINGEKK